MVHEGITSIRISDPRRGGALVACALAACAGDPARFTPEDDPGTGTGTLAIAAELRAVPGVSNGTDPATFTMAYEVRVVRGGERIATGAVTIATVAGETALVFDTRAGGAWRGAASGYERVQVLDVVADGDHVHDVRIVGPDIHAFSAPQADAMVDSSRPLVVTWWRHDAADLARLTTLGAAPFAVEDSGMFELPAGSLRSDATRIEQEVLVLQRTASLVPAGAAAGSTVSVTVSNELKLSVEPTAPPTE